MLRIGPRSRPEYVQSKAFDGRAGRTQCAMQQRKTTSRRCNNARQLPEELSKAAVGLVDLWHKGAQAQMVRYKVDRTGTKLPTR